MDNNILINIYELKQVMSRINNAVEKSVLNPKSGWLELKTIDNSKMLIKVSNYDYYLEATIAIESNDDSQLNLHATLDSETFISLVSKLDDDYVKLTLNDNSLFLSTVHNEYNFPLIKENNLAKSLDVISFNDNVEMSGKFDGLILNSISEVNVKGLIDTMFSKEVQQYIYVDNLSAITFTENIYVNSFNNKVTGDFKFLLNQNQAKLLKIFADSYDVYLYINDNVDYDKNYKIKLQSENLKLVMIVQSMQMVEKFPAIKLRKLAEVSNDTHAIIDKKQLDRALARLMVFDKKFDITVMNYSKLVFKKDCVELVSIKNKNVEKVTYINSVNAYEHESIIRFADLVKQLKAITSREIDISYGNTPAIAINSGNLIQLIPEIQAGR